MEKIVQIPSKLEIVVNYHESVNLLLERGKYDWIHGVIGYKFFTAKHEKYWYKLSIELVYFGYETIVSGDEARRKIVEIGYRPAELHDLLAFGAKYPETQRSFPIISLGSYVELNAHHVPCLIGNDSKRGVTISPVLTEFKNCRFLAVKNEIEKSKFVIP